MKNRKLRVLLTAAMGLAAMSVPARQGKGAEWLKDALFYQIYPSSFMDSDGNGIGDLPGITSKLAYIQSLGVNAIWLNPIFESGWFDGGYDVIDFYKVDSRFGTNSDLVDLVREAHKRGIKVCLDLVAGHTSDKCAWFTESKEKDANQRYSDYYIWSDTVSDWEKKNIELRRKDPYPDASTRGAWVEENALRAKYYLKNYFECQPALNYGYADPDPDHPWEQSVDAPGPQAVRREMRNIMAFWFDKGVDGFRVDMAASLVKNDKDKAAVKQLWQEMRAWKDKNYPGCVFISEWSNPENAIPAGFNIDFMMHFGTPGYSSLFFEKGTPFGERNKFRHAYFSKKGQGIIAEFAENYTRLLSKTKDLGYIAIPSANHDFQRPNCGDRNTLPELKVAMTFFLTMPGVPFIYYGDEIGMKYLHNLPNKEGATDRAGTRTPMQWDSGETAGFSTCSPDRLYLPVDTENGKITVTAEESDKNSMLNYVRRLIRLRHSSKALNNEGEWELLSDIKQPYPMVYKRSYGSESYIVALNPSAKKVKTNLKPQHVVNSRQVFASGKAKYKTGKNFDIIEMNGLTAAIYQMR